MKLKYNDKTYVVFATEEEIVDEDLIIKIEEDYFEWSSYSKLLLNLTTTQVLRHITTNHKVLQAYKVKTKEEEIGRINKSIRPLVTLANLVNYIKSFPEFKNQATIRSNEDCFLIVLLEEEETEEQVKARICNSNLDDIKYFKL